VIRTIHAHPLAIHLCCSSFSTISAIAQDIPAELAPPQQRPLVGKYAAKGVQIYVCSVDGVANECGGSKPLRPSLLTRRAPMIIGEF
jgi:hypothetical protein